MANGRMHHHDKYAAAKDGHRHDDPHGVTNGPYPRGFLWREQQADAMEADTAAGGIQHEGHEVFDENVDYGQRVTAFGDIERAVADQQIEAWRDRPRPDSWSGSSPVIQAYSEGYADDTDQMDEELATHPDDNTALYARKAIFGQDYTYSKERRQHEAQTGTSLGRLAKPGAGDKEWEQTVARAR